MKRVRCFGHEKIKSISFGNRVMLFLLYGRRTGFHDFLKFSENFRKSSEVFGNLREFSENFGNGSKVIFRFFKISGKSSEIFRIVQKTLENDSKVIFRCFYDFLKFLENLRKSSEVFGKLRNCLENFRNGSKVIFRCFYDFLKFSENLQKCSEVRRYFH